MTIGPKIKVRCAIGHRQHTSCALIRSLVRSVKKEYALSHWWIDTPCPGEIGNIRGSLQDLTGEDIREAISDGPQVTVLEKFHRSLFCVIYA